MDSDTKSLVSEGAEEAQHSDIEKWVAVEVKHRDDPLKKHNFTTTNSSGASQISTPQVQAYQFYFLGEIEAFAPSNDPPFFTMMS